MSQVKFTLEAYIAFDRLKVTFIAFDKLKPTLSILSIAGLPDFDIDGLID